MELTTLKKSIRIIFVYLVTALLWILFADKLLNYLFGTAIGQVSKWVIFIFITAGILLYVIYTSFRMVEKSNEILKQEKENLRILLNNTNIGLSVFDSNGNKVYSNERFYEISGYNFSEIVTIYDIKRLFEEPEKAESFLIGAGKSDFMEIKLKNNKTIEISRQDIYDNKQIVIVDDISRRVELEKTLKASEEKYRKIIETAEEGIWIIDDEGKTMFHNRKIASILEYEPKDFINTTIYDFIRDEDVPTIKNYIKLCIHAGKWKTDIFFASKKGNGVWGMVSAVPLIDEAGRYNGILLMVTDINTRKKAEESIMKAKIVAEDASKAKSQFLANMSHEMRTPLNGIIGMEYLLSNTKVDEKQKGYLTMLRESADNLLHLINDVLDLARLESKRIEFNEISFEIGNLINDTNKLLKTAADKKNIVIETKIDSKINYRIKSDPKYLQQVLKNLISNGIKYSHENSTINIYVEEVEKNYLAYIKISVQDKGVGIHREKLDRIFETFYQIDEPDKQRAGGTGLGLAISKKIVEYMSGKIDVWSEPEKGSIFSIEIPFKFAEESAGDATMPGAGYRDNLSGKKVLIVEDNEINIALIENLLTRKNMSVDISMNGEEAVEKHFKNDYDIILMDIQMPKMNGYQATAAIREHEAESGRKIPIIALTAYAMEEDKEKCLSAGMDDYLSKPFKADELYTLMLKYL